MSDPKQTLRHHLSTSRARLESLAGRLREADWERAVQVEDGRWTAHQMLGHLAAAEVGQLNTLRGIVEGGPGVGNDFDLDRWNARQIEKQAGRSPAELLAALSASRQQVLAALDALSAEQLERTGRHGRGDTLRVVDIFYRIGEHELEHVELMEQALGIGT